MKHSNVAMSLRLRYKNLGYSNENVLLFTRNLLRLWHFHPEDREKILQEVERQQQDQNLQSEEAAFLRRFSRLRQFVRSQISPLWDRAGGRARRDSPANAESAPARPVAETQVDGTRTSIPQEDIAQCVRGVRECLAFFLYVLNGGDASAESDESADSRQAGKEAA